MPRTILVTGSAQGIGFSIVQALATHTPSDTFIVSSRTAGPIDAAIASLRELDVQSTLEPLVLDIDDDESIAAAVDVIKTKFGSLDVLVNNAAMALIPPTEPLADHRAAHNRVYNTNITSVANMSMAFLPLLTSSLRKGKVINISSARGSLHRSTVGKLPPTISLPYCVSKTALNALTIEMDKMYRDQGVAFYAANPGHCKTRFNGYRGKRDPLEGADVVVGLVNGDVEGGTFWETLGGDAVLRAVEW